MLNPEKRAAIKAALDSAHSICSLAGLQPTPESEAMDKRVLDGELTPGEAAVALAKAAKDRATKKAADRS